MTISGDEWTVQTEGPDQTLALGRALGQSAQPGLVVALIGPLGAGKTQLVRGVSEGLQVADPRQVSSPTFVLIQEYPGRLPIYHFDAYRLTSPDQFLRLGPEEYFESDGVSLVEWADRVAEHLPRGRLDVHITLLGPNRRTLHFYAHGPSAVAVLRTLSQTWQRKDI
jgi:tRNA threonylcarbamoyladenosine biosynthesis protein TsaE